MTGAINNTNALRQARLRKRRRALGIDQCNVQLPRRWHGLIESLATALRDTPSLPATEFLVYWRDEHGRLHPLRELIPT